LIVLHYFHLLTVVIIFVMVPVKRRLQVHILTIANKFLPIRVYIFQNALRIALWSGSTHTVHHDKPISLFFRPYCLRDWRLKLVQTLPCHYRIPFLVVILLSLYLQLLCIIFPSILFLFLIIFSNQLLLIHYLSITIINPIIIIHYLLTISLILILIQIRIICIINIIQIINFYLDSCFPSILVLWTFTAHQLFWQIKRLII